MRPRLSRAFAVLLVVSATTFAWPAVEVVPASVDMSDVLVGAAAARTTITIRNPGGASLTVVRIDLTPAGGPFRLENVVLGPTQIAPSTEETFEVVFRPTTADPSPRQAVVSVITDDPARPVIDIDVRARGIRPQVEVRPTRVDFGVNLSGDPVFRSIEVVNVPPGNSVLGLTDVVLAADGGGVYELMPLPSLPVQIQPGGQLRLGLSYTPDAANPDPPTGTLIVRTDDPTDPEIRLHIEGRSSYAQALLAPEPPLGFGFVDVGQNADLVFTLSNSATASANLDIVSVTPPGGASFTIFDDRLTGESISPGQARTLGLRFTPSAEGEASDLVRIETSNPEVGTLDLPLAGVGRRCNCEDGNICNGVAVCGPGGQCVAGTPPPDGTPCFDNDPCTVGDSCGGGVCLGTARVCDDANDCNGTETCEASTGACLPGLPLADGDACDDRDACTLGEICDAMQCLGQPKDCADGNPCTMDVCQANGTCAWPSTCDDFDPCTDDSCNTAGVCENTPRCLAADACSERFCLADGTCTADVPLNCDDGDLCTTDSCDPLTGCANDPVQCDFNDPCREQGCSRTSGCYDYPVAEGTACGQGLVCDGSSACVPVNKVWLADGPWPQDDPFRLAPQRGLQLAGKYQVVRDLTGASLVPQNGELGAPECEYSGEGCDGTCGLSFEKQRFVTSPLGTERHELDVPSPILVAADDANTFVSFTYRRRWPDCPDDGSPDCATNLSKIIRLGTGSAAGPALDRMSPSVRYTDFLPAVSQLIQPGWGPPVVDMVIHDLLVIKTDQGQSYLTVLANLHLGYEWFTVLMGLDTQNITLQWVILVAADSVPRPSSVEVSPTGVFLVLVPNVAGEGTIHRAALPDLDQTPDFNRAAAVRLPGDKGIDDAGFRLSEIALDDVGRVYALSWRLMWDAPGCRGASGTQRHTVYRLRVYDPNLRETLLDVTPQLDGVRSLLVEEAQEVADVGTLQRAILLGHQLDCDPLVKHQYKTPYEFTEDDFDLFACPSRFEAVCNRQFPLPPAGHGDCCLPRAEAGCSNPQIEQLVCDTRPECCQPGPWNEYCVAAVSTCPAPDPTETECPCRGGCRSSASCTNGSYAVQVFSFATDLLEERTVSFSGSKVVSVPYPVQAPALDGHGHLMTGTERVVNLLDGEPFVGPDLGELGIPLLAEPAGATGETRFVAFSVGAGPNMDVVAGRVGNVFQLTSTVEYEAGRYDGFDNRLYPIANGRLLALGQNRLQLLAPATDYFEQRDLLNPAADTDMPRVTLCPSAGCPAVPITPNPPCTGAVCPHTLDLGLPIDAVAEGFMVSGSLTQSPPILRDPWTSPTPWNLDWVLCDTRRRTNVYNPATGNYELDTEELFQCPDDQMIAQWEDYHAGNRSGYGMVSPNLHALAGGGETLPACVSYQTRQTTSYFPSTTRPERVVTTKYLRCESYRETFRAPPQSFVVGAGETGFVGLELRRHVLYDFFVYHDDTTCPWLGEPRPFRGVLMGQPTTTTIRDAQGRITETAAPGESLTLSTAPIAAGETVTHEVIAGDAQLTDLGGDPARAALVMQGEGLVIVRVASCDTNGLCSVNRNVMLRGTGSETGRPCTLDDDGAFNLCDVRLSMDIPDAEQDLPAYQQPATAGMSVQLHDRSFQATVTDHQVDGFGLPVVLNRSYSSSRQPRSGGLLGGWTFGFDQRLAPVRARSGLKEKAGTLPVDMAFHDGSGRVDVFHYPIGAAVASQVEEKDFTASEPYFVYNHATQTLEPRIFRARIVTYDSPRGYFSKLRSYTLLLASDETSAEKHPFHRPGDTLRQEMQSTDIRFYELTEADGTRRVFSARGSLTRIIDPQYREIELLYDEDLHPLTQAPALSGFIDTAGLVWRVRWTDSHGPYPRIRSVTDPHGRQVRYNYRSFGSRGALLRSVQLLFTDSDPDLTVSQLTGYRYTPEGRLWKIIEPGRAEDEPTLTIEYDADGRVERQILGDGGVAGQLVQEGGTYTFLQTAGTDVVTVTDPRGTVRTYTLIALPQNGPNVVESVAYSDSVYQEPSGGGPPTSPTRTTQNLTTSFTYYASGQLKQITRADAAVTDFAYNDLGQLTSRTLPTDTDPISGAANARNWSFAYTPITEGSTGRFLCSLLTSETAPGQQPVVYKYHDFDKDEPGLICQIRRVEPPVSSHSGTHSTRLDDYSFAQIFVYQPAGYLRGALLVDAIQSPAGTDTVVDPPLNQDNAYDSTSGVQVEGRFYKKIIEPSRSRAEGYRGSKFPIGKLGHISEVRLKGSTPTECGSNATPESRVSYVTDLRGNITRQNQHRGTGRLAISSKFDKKDRLLETIVDPDRHAHKTEYEWNERDLLVRQTVTDKDQFTEADTGGMVDPRPAARTVEIAHFYDRLGRRWATVVDGGTKAQRTFELTGRDGMGNVVITLEPGPAAGADFLGDSMLDSVITDVETAGKTPHDLFSTFNLTSGTTAFPNMATTSGGPVARNPRLVERRYTFDASQALIEATTSDGGDPGGTCPPGRTCNASHLRTEQFYLDVVDRLRAEDPGRTDGSGRFLQFRSYTASGLLAVSQMVEPGGCGASGMTVLAETTYLYGTPLQAPTEIRVTGHDGRVRRLSATTPIVEETSACVENEDLASTLLTYDGRGQVIRREERQYQIGGSNLGTVPTRVTYYRRDHDGRATDRETAEGHRAAPTAILTRYNHLDQACHQGAWSLIAGTPVAAVRSLNSTYDSAGLPTETLEIHAGAPRVARAKPVRIHRRYEYDRLFRRSAEIQLLEPPSGGTIESANKLVARIFYDSLGRERAVSNPDGSFTEERYDGLGNVVYTALKTPSDGVRGARFTVSPSGHRLEERTFFLGIDPTAAEVTRNTKAYDYDVFSNAVTVYPHGRGGIPVERLFNESGHIVWRREVTGAQFAYQSNALGMVTRIEGTRPSGTVPGLAAANLLQTRIKEFRYNGLGHTVLARSSGDLSGSTTPIPIATVLQAHDSFGNVWEERQIHHGDQACSPGCSPGWQCVAGRCIPSRFIDAATRSSYDVQVSASYDAWDNLEELTYDRSDPTSFVVDYGVDGHGRTYSVEVNRGTSRQVSISYAHQGDYVVEREVNIDSPSRLDRTEWAYNELGHAYRLEHNIGYGYTHRKYWQGTREVYSTEASGIIQHPDPTTPLVGVSHFGLSADPDIFDELTEYKDAIANRWPSTFTATRHDGFGSVVHSLSTTYVPDSRGTRNINGVWRVMEGSRLLSEKSTSYDPDYTWHLDTATISNPFAYTRRRQPLDVRNVAFDYSTGGLERVTGSHHSLLEEPSTINSIDQIAALRHENGVFRDPIGNTQHTPDAEEVYTFGHTAAGTLTDDGTIDPSQSSGGRLNEHPEMPRYTYSYDLFGQLVEVRANDPRACRQGPPFVMRPVKPFADRYRVLYDALNRRIQATYLLPDGCAPNRLTEPPAERTRQFYYRGTRLLMEMLMDDSGNSTEVDGRNTFVHGANSDMPFIKLMAYNTAPSNNTRPILPLESSREYLVFENLNGRFVGFLDLESEEETLPGPEYAHYRSYPSFKKGVREAVMRRGSVNAEQEGLGELTYLEGVGYVADNRINRVSGHWDASKKYEEAISISRLQSVLGVVNAMALALSPIPIIGDVAGLVADVSNIAFDLYLNGPSIQTAMDATLAVGFAAIGVVSTVAGPPGRAAATGARGVRGARAAARAGGAVADLATAQRSLDAVATQRKAAKARGAGRAATNVDDVRRTGRDIDPPGVKACKINCFAAGTLVHTSDGLVAIEQIRPGDMVTARGENTGEVGYREVTRTFTTPGRPTLYLRLISEGGGVETLEVTPNHPFMVEGRGWVLAGSLRPNDAVLGAGGDRMLVDGETVEGAAPTTVFNLEVEDLHTYFVGRGGAWVHNDSCPDTDDFDEFFREGFDPEPNSGYDDMLEDIDDALRGQRVNPNVGSPRSRAAGDFRKDVLSDYVPTPEEIRAREIINAGGQRAVRNQTVNVSRGVPGGPDYIVTAQPPLTPAQRQTLMPNEAYVRGTGHAEVDAVLNGAEVVNPSRKVCPNCRIFLEERGVQSTVPNTGDPMFPFGVFD